MTESPGRRRVVVTGQGLVSPIGIGVDNFWASLKQGRCGLGEVQTFPTHDLKVTIAGEVLDFDPKKHLTSRSQQMADRYSQFAGASALEAVRQSGMEMPLGDEQGARAASIIGSGAGGMTTLENAYKALYGEGKRHTHPLTLLRFLGSSAAALVSMEYNITGPVFGVVSACSSATHSIGLAYRMIRDGAIDLALTGASEATLTWGTTFSWQALHVLDQEGCFPFSKRRNGTVLAEGGGILMLEEYEMAKERGANILAEVMGFGMTADAGDMVNPKASGPANAMKFALDEAGLAPADIDYLNAHGTATRVNDVNETRAVKLVFGGSASDLSISSTKSMHGHLLGGGGAVEAIACIKAMEDNFVPPTINLDEPDPECDLDYTPNKGRSKEITYTMSNSLAFGGLNTVLVFGPDPGA